MLKTSFIVLVSLLTSVSCFATPKNNSKRSSSSRSSSANKSSGRNGRSARAAATNAGRTIANLQTSDTSESSNTDEETKNCEDLFYECMNKKTTEALMQHEEVYDDYSDMLSDIYAGMVAPAFKCLYSNNVKDLYATYYFGNSISDPNGGQAELISKNSIEYYKFLKQNATSVSIKKIPITSVHYAVLSMAGINTNPIGMQSEKLPNVSYKITTINPIELFESNADFCVNDAKEKNPTDFENYSKNDTKKWREKWKSGKPTVNSSCKDYEVFLSDKLSKSKKEAKEFISSLKVKLTSAIEEHNLAIEAEEELKRIGL